MLRLSSNFGVKRSADDMGGGFGIEHQQMGPLGVATKSLSKLSIPSDMHDPKFVVVIFTCFLDVVGSSQFLNGVGEFSTCPPWDT